jgi:hypothetical protein
MNTVSSRHLALAAVCGCSTLAAGRQGAPPPGVPPPCYVYGASAGFCLTPSPRDCPPAPGFTNGRACADLRPGAPLYTTTTKTPPKCDEPGRLGHSFDQFNRVVCVSTPRACDPQAEYTGPDENGCYRGQPVTTEALNDVLNGGVCWGPPCPPEPPPTD